jgi:hypothetical protein
MVFYLYDNQGCNHTYGWIKLFFQFLKFRNTCSAGFTPPLDWEAYVNNVLYFRL